eukprot:7187439-Prorocentrum_lima.AAC.1
MPATSDPLAGSSCPCDPVQPLPPHQTCASQFPLQTCKESHRPEHGFHPICFLMCVLRGDESFDNLGFSN